MSQKSQLSLFRADDLLVTPDCKELETAVEASLYELEQVENTLKERLFRLLDCQKSGLSQDLPITEQQIAALPAQRALRSLNVTDLADLRTKILFFIRGQNTEAD